ncbi:LOW QUALITY PROTEIN: uncharacterized protein [Macrobrachium rosenbergii]|uniref:LOW QUALITY PROTEIN: uncharacterized protein n=1 Tax=Macrobrachium rosenbergii TaxID=79674 RepID=UPI0034D3A16A
MALLSSGKCGSNASGGSGGGSPPPPLPSVRNVTGSGNAAALLPPAMYCPMLPPWHLALLTHHALHVRGLGMTNSGAGPYLPLPPMFSPAALPPGGGTGLPRAHLPLHSITHSQEPNSGGGGTGGGGGGEEVVTTTYPPPQQRWGSPAPSYPLDLTNRDYAAASRSRTSSEAAKATPLIPKAPKAPALTKEEEEEVFMPTRIKTRWTAGGAGVMDESQEMSPNPHDPGARFQWLQCTRYHPPKLPRVKRREGGQKRKLGRNPRVPFSSTQLAALEARFNQSQYLSSCDVADLSALLNLTETRVKIWFQNRRARERRDREARAKGLLPPSSLGTHSSPVPSSSSASSASGGGPLPPSALALYQFTAALAPGSASAFSPVLPRPSFETTPAHHADSSCEPTAHHDDSPIAPPSLRDVSSLLPSNDASRSVPSPILKKVNNIMGSSPPGPSAAIPAPPPSPMGCDLMAPAGLPNDCPMSLSPKKTKSSMLSDASPDTP